MTPHLFYCFNLLFFTPLFSSYASTAEEKTSPSLRPVHQSFFLTQSKSKPSSAVSRPRSVITSPDRPWTLEETQDFVTFVQEARLWDRFFKVLSNLPPPPALMDFTQYSQSSEFTEYTYLRHCPPALVQGATLKVGHTLMPITHTGLIQMVINDGTLLRALKNSQDRASSSLIKKLEEKKESR